MSNLLALADAVSLHLSNSNLNKIANDKQTESDKSDCLIAPIITDNANDCELKVKMSLSQSLEDSKSVGNKIKKSRVKSSPSIDNMTATEKLLKRREQIAAASRKSRERRKQEFMNLKKENILLWENVEQLTGQVERIGGIAPTYDHITALKMKRTGGESSKYSSDEEDDSNESKTKTPNKRRRVSDDVEEKIRPSTLNLYPPLLAPHTPSSISILDNSNNGKITNGTSNVGTSERNDLSGATSNLPNLPFDLTSTSTNFDIQKIKPLITLSETRANWFLNHFKTDLISAFKDILTEEEQSLLTNMSIKLYQS